LEIFNIQNWQNFWGAFILIGLPLIFVLATLIYIKRKATGKKVLALQIGRIFLIPLSAVYLTLSKIIGLSTELTLLRAIQTIIMLIVVSMCYRIVDYFVFSKNNILINKEVMPKLARDVIHLLVVALVYTFVLSVIWQLDLGSLLTALGVSSIVLGLALQEPLGNLFNGISLLMATPFNRGDWVDINGEIGRASEINWRSVKIQTRFNEEIIIPNNMLAKAKIKNLSRPFRKYAELLKFGFSYDDAPEKVKKVLLDIAEGNEKILDSPPPAIYTLSCDDFAIIYGIKFHIKKYEDLLIIKDEIITTVYHAALDNELTIPFPRQDIQMNMAKKTGNEPSVS